MPVDSPAALVEEFKKSGEFDRLRRELLAQFRDQDESYSALKSRVEEIGRQRLSTDNTLKYMAQEIVQKELMQEVERYPIVERTVADVRIFSDPAFLASVQGSIQKILNDARGGKSSTPKEKPENATKETKETETRAQEVSENGAKQPENLVPGVPQCESKIEPSSTMATGDGTDSSSPLQSIRLPSSDTPQPITTTSLHAPAGNESNDANVLGILSNGPAESVKSSEPSSSGLNPKVTISNHGSPVAMADVEMKDIVPED